MGRDEKDKNLTTKPTLVLVQTCAYSGATLLAFLLGSHPQIATVGEMNGMLDVDIDTYLCSCGQRIKDCGFWQSVEIAMRDKGFEFDTADFRTRFLPVGSPLAYRLRMRFSRINAPASMQDAIFCAWPGETRRLKELVARNDALIETVLNITGKTVFFDTSKEDLRFQSMRKFSKYDVRAIHLIRDVRGVVASRLRRGHFGEDAHKAARRWVKSHTSYQRVLKTVPEGNYMRVRYEDLCQDTQSTLQGLYRFLGVDPDVRLTDFGAFSHHIIGNPMRVRSLSEIRLDKRWESLLTEEQLAEIKQIAGKLSHQYGYD